MQFIQINPIQKFDPSQIKQSIDAILANNQLCAMATVTLGGKPHANTAFYCHNNDYSVYVLTPPDTRHGQNLAANPAISLSIYNSTQPWDSLKSGLQAFGSAKVAEGADVRTAFELYTQRFPTLKQYISRPEEIAKIESRFYRISLDQIRLYDEPCFGQEVWIDLRLEDETGSTNHGIENRFL